MVAVGVGHEAAIVGMTVAVVKSAHQLKHAKHIHQQQQRQDKYHFYLRKMWKEVRKGEG